MNLNLRPITTEDCKLLFDWVNDPEVRKNSFESRLIEWKIHEEWFFKKIKIDDSIILILELDKTPIGQIRFDKNENLGTLHIDFSIDPAFRGIGYGKKIINLGCNFVEANFNLRILHYIAEVKSGNIASQKSFLSNNFYIKYKEFDRVVLEKVTTK